MKVLPLDRMAEPLVEASSQTADRPRRNQDQAQQKRNTGSKRQGFPKSQTESEGSSEKVSRDETSQPQDTEAKAEVDRQIVDSQKLISLLNKKPSSSNTAKKEAFKRLAVKSLTSVPEEKIKKI